MHNYSNLYLSSEHKYVMHLLQCTAYIMYIYFYYTRIIHSLGHYMVHIDLMDLGHNCEHISDIISVLHNITNILLGHKVSKLTVTGLNLLDKLLMLLLFVILK